MPIDLTTKIRDILNHPWKKEIIFQDRVKWNKIWASLDTFDDTQEAIKYYLNLPAFGANEGGYLFTYGILQAINLQQDALNNLLQALFEKKINWKEEYPELYEIREHRNDSIGHPSSRRNDESFHMIGRYSISKEGFTLGSYFPKNGEQSKFQEIKIIECIESQSTLLTTILSETMQELKNEIALHKKQFKGQSIKDKIPSTFNYHISKLFEHASGNYPTAKADLQIIKETIQSIKNEVEKRYFKLDALSGLEYTVNLIEYIIDRLEKTLINNKINDENELTIFIESLRANSSELFEMIKDIDSEFK